ncbi:MAG: hypothetical protein AAF518_07310 [Spirochaetota bacterium]
MLYQHIVYTLAILSFLLVSFCKPPTLPNPYRKVYQTSPTSKAENYKLAPNWTDRIHPLEGIHLKYARRMNEIDKFREVPQPSKRTEEMRKEVLALSKTFTPKIQELINKHVYGIYFCEQLGSTGLTGYIFSKGKPAGGFVILDTNMINKPANDWISDKENTVFKKSESYSLRMEIEYEKSNTPLNTMRYIFLHELGHILGVVREDTPKVLASEPSMLLISVKGG